MARPSTNLGDDPQYLEAMARFFRRESSKLEKSKQNADNKEKLKLHAARFELIAHKVKHLENCLAKGVIAYMRELETAAGEKGKR